MTAALARQCDHCQRSIAYYDTLSCWLHLHSGITFCEPPTRLATPREDHR